MAYSGRRWNIAWIKLTEDTLYEVHVMVEDGGEFDLSDTEKEIKIAVILGNK